MWTSLSICRRKPPRILSIGTIEEPQNPRLSDKGVLWSSACSKPKGVRAKARRLIGNRQASIGLAEGQRQGQDPKRLLTRAGALMETTTSQNPAVMAPVRSRICANVPCLCTVPDGEEYCGPACRDGAREGTGTACQCDHITCPQTTRPFANRANLHSL